MLSSKSCANQPSCDRNLEKPPKQPASSTGQNSRPEHAVRHVRALPEKNLVIDRQSTFRLCCGGRSNKRVQGGGWQHLGRGVSDVHGHQRGAIEFVEVQALDLVVVVYADFVALGWVVSKGAETRTKPR